MYKLLICGLLCFSPGILSAQHIVQGIIVDDKENAIADVKISEPGTSNITYTGADGHFTFFYFAEDLNISFEHSDYLTLAMPLSKSISHQIFMVRKDSGNSYNLHYPAGYLDFNAKNPNKRLEIMPYLLGEADINRQLQMLPGIEHGSEGFSNLYVRGGNVDENLMLYNGTPVYNFNHLFGLSSIFHNNGIENTAIYKGISPSRYGGRLSSVIEVNSHQNSEFSGSEGSFEISPLSAGLYLRFIKKNKSYFTVSARRSWVDLLLPVEERENGLNANFHDIQLNYGNVLKDGSKIDISLLQTRDFYLLGLTGSSSDTTNIQSRYTLTYKWSNIVGSVKYSKDINKQLTSAHSLHFSSYVSHQTFKEQILNSTNTIRIPTSTFNYSNGIMEYLAQSNWSYTASNSSAFNFGLQNSIKTFRTGYIHRTASHYPNADDIDESIGSRGFKPSMELSLYGDNNLRYGSEWLFTYGLRTSLYVYDGYSKPFVEPRLHLSYYPDARTRVKFAYNRQNQFIKLLNIGGSGDPNNVWVPATRLVPPQNAHIAEISYERKLGNSYAVSANAYYKVLNNIQLVDNFFEATNPENDWQSQVFSGKGTARGLELMAMKNEGILTGWISYVLSKATRSFELLSEEDFLFDFDRTHMVKLYLNLDAGEYWDIGINYLIGSGQLFTIPDGKFLDINGDPQLEYSSLNNYRVPVYQRFDVSVIKASQYNYIDQTWKFFLYNMIGFRNPLLLTPEFENASLTNLRIRRDYVQFVPGIAYVVRF